MKRLFLCALLITSCGALFPMEDQITPVDGGSVEDKTWKKVGQYSLDFASGYGHGAAVAFFASSIVSTAHDSSIARRAVLFPSAFAAGGAVGWQALSKVDRDKQENPVRRFLFATGFFVSAATVVGVSIYSLSDLLGDICDDNESSM